MIVLFPPNPRQDTRESDFTGPVGQRVRHCADLRVTGLLTFDR